MPRTLRFALALCLLWTTGAWAQKLTQSQYAILKNDILVVNQAEHAAAVAASDFQRIADAYNVVLSPAYWIWKTSLTAKSIYEDTDGDGGVWDWSAHMAQTVAERGAWDSMFYASPVNPSLAQTRAAWTKIYSGNTAPQQAQKAHLLAIARRPARRIEQVLRVTTLGDGTTGNPANMSYEGTISYQDILICLTQTP